MDYAMYFTAYVILTVFRQIKTAVIVRGILSVCLSVRPSVTFQCFIQTNEDAIVQSLASGRTIILVSPDVKFTRIFTGDHCQRRRHSEALPLSLAKSGPIIGNNLKTVQHRR